MNPTNTCLKPVLLAAVLAAAGCAAHAEGLYVEGQLGSPEYKNSASGVNGVYGSGSGAGGTLAGGWQLTPNFALEGGVFDLGHIDDASGKVKLRGGFVDAVGSYEVVPKWSLLASAGLAEGRFSTSNGDDSSPALKLGAGLQYRLSQQVSLRAAYDHYHFSDAFDAKPNIGEFALGLKIGF